MTHDVYLCYDKKDQELCDALSAIFEDNNIKTWVKSRDFSTMDSATKITEAISDSKCFVLLHSKNSEGKNHVVTESDIAFSNDVPIVVLNLDNSKPTTKLEYILQGQTIISAFPNSEIQLKKLVGKVLGFVGKSTDNIKIDSRHQKIIERKNPDRRNNVFKKYVKIAVPIVVALILIYFFVVLPAGQHTTQEGSFSINVTDVAVDGNKYTVYGESYNLPADSVNYLMNIKFFDKNDDIVYEVNSTADEFKSGVIWSGNLHEDNATHIGFKLTDIEGNLLSNENYAIE